MYIIYNECCYQENHETTHLAIYIILGVEHTADCLVTWCGDQHTTKVVITTSTSFTTFLLARAWTATSSLQYII